MSYYCEFSPKCRNFVLCVFAKQADVSVRSSASAQLRVIAKQIRFLQEQAKKVAFQKLLSLM
jgi:Protein of unknown function (DUF2452)